MHMSEERGADGEDGATSVARLAGTSAPLAPLAPQYVGEGEWNPMLGTGDFDRITNASYAQVVDVERQCIRFKDDIDYVTFNIGIGLSYIIDLIPPDDRIFYVGFRGPRGAGKTSATRFASKIARDGLHLASVTLPALVSACSERKTLCIEEFDAQSARCPDLDYIVRGGVALDAIHYMMVPDGRGWKREPVPIGGMKFINWKDPIDDALMQRVLVIDMAPNATTRMVINNENVAYFTTPLQIWFMAQSASAHRRWTSETVAELIADTDHHLERKVDAIASVVPRQKQKAFWMLAVCEIFGWDFDAAITELIRRQPEGEDYSDFKELVVELYLQKRELLDGRGERSEPVVVSLVDFKQDITERANTRRLDPLKVKGRQGTLTWTGLRQECGFVDGVNEVQVRTQHGKRFLTFDERVQRTLGVLDEQTALGSVPGDGQ